MKKTRNLSYCLAINEAFHQLMSDDSSVVLIGQGLKSPWYVGKTADGLMDSFGESRIIDTPVSENAVTGVAVGASLAGMKAVVVHPRMDFMFYAFDPIINQAANWSYMFDGKVSAPVVFWGIINRGGEQAAQHSQALHAMFAHVPGLKVVMPSTPYDAKGLMVSAVKDPDPVVFIDDRWLYNEEEHVPEEMYSVPIGKGVVRKKGADITIVGISFLAREAVKASGILRKSGIDAEVVDPRTVSPLDMDIIIKSVKKTGRLLVADVGWLSGGVSAEITAGVAESTAVKSLKCPVRRLAIPDCPAPMGKPLEEAYYPSADNIVEAVRQMM